MNATLYINLYNETNPERRKELETCLYKNSIVGFDKIWLVVEEKDKDYGLTLIRTILKESSSTIILKIVEASRPPFQTYIDIANSYEELALHMVCNSDIFIEPENLVKLKNLNWNNKLFVALSRHDLYPNGEYFLLDRADSQDALLWYGKCDIETALCPWGVPGGDNSICWKFHEKGYKVVNPAKDIVIKHLHLVLGNNYREGIGGAVIASSICPPPYFFAAPCFSFEIK